jgi:hypothetical protein
MVVVQPQKAGERVKDHFLSSTTPRVPTGAAGKRGMPPQQRGKERGDEGQARSRHDKTSDPTLQSPATVLSARPSSSRKVSLCSRHMLAPSLLHIHAQSTSSSSSFLYLHALAESHVCAGLFLSRKSVISHSAAVLQLRENLKGRGLVLGSDDDDDADS